MEGGSGADAADGQYYLRSEGKGWGGWEGGVGVEGWRVGGMEGWRGRGVELV